MEQVVPGQARLVVTGGPGSVHTDCACPVIFVPIARHHAEITLGMDAHDPAEGAVDFAFDTAQRWGVVLRAVHAWRFPSCVAELPFGVPEADRGAWEDQEVQLLADELRPWREKYPQVEVLEDVRLLPPAQALVRLSASAGLVVVGRRSDGGSGVVERVLLRESLCPVAVVSA
ncbi:MULTISPECIES: universal stress protein [unclassified Streptomyces]|uniref:universal stress protein n=1 Tax=unclassified Streptomyces TaxID=2593676 RepID=UPI002259DEDC|nr:MULTISPECIES: universal stress protein [unclassified Streptomyces]MCX5336621.1 universal stress protein [Streptomyces sp. NBC_00140]MCX5367517.1 universal stress protein [Streptomyces sp. NBC_00124]